MMPRNSALAAFGCVMVFTVAVAACGGGGGGGGGGPSPHPSPSLAPSIPPGSPHPALDGDMFAFSGTHSQSIQRFRPSPTPPVQIINSTITQNQTVHTGRTFHGAAATDFQMVEVDTAPNQTLTVNSDNYVQLPAGTGSFFNLGFSSTDSNGVTIDQNLVGSNVILDQLPETVNATWSNSAAGATVVTSPDGITATQNVNANGSYTETIHDPIIGDTTATENSDGSGTLDAPTTAFFGAGTGTHFAFQAPSGPPNSTITITLTATGAPPPTPAPIVAAIPAWYSQSPTLASDQITDNGLSAMPGGCAATTFGASAVKLHEVKTRLDALFGATETETVDTFIVPGAGPACVQTSDTINLFYDFTGQSVSSVLASTPTQTTAVSETVGLQSETIHSVARHPAGLTRNMSADIAQQFVFAQNRFERQRQVLRLRQLRALRDLLSKRGNWK